jgi:hypothetical protein
MRATPRGTAGRSDRPPSAMTYGIPMKHLALSLLASLVLSLGLPSAQASVLDTATTAAASQTELYGVFHDTATNFVFVKLPQGWVFAGCDKLREPSRSVPRCVDRVRLGEAFHRLEVPGNGEGMMSHEGAVRASRVASVRRVARRALPFGARARSSPASQARPPRPSSSSRRSASDAESKMCGTCPRSSSAAPSLACTNALVV